LGQIVPPTTSQEQEDENIEEDTTCGFGLESGYIVGGLDAKRGAYPFMALLGYKGITFAVNEGILVFFM